MRPFIGDDRQEQRLVTIFSFSSAQPSEGCNQKRRQPVINNGVDTLLFTWMILMQVCWLVPRFSTTMTQLASWFVAYTRLSRKWSEPIGRDELLRKTFAK